MQRAQIRRAIVSLVELYNQGISVHSINTELREIPSDDAGFLTPVIVIKYQCDDQTSEHEVRVYEDGCASDF